VVVIDVEVPVTPVLSTAVTVVAVDGPKKVVKTTVATPDAFVVEVTVEKVPLESDLVQVTVLPAVPTALSKESASRAVIVTLVPATGEFDEEVTRYLAAGPTCVVMLAVVPTLDGVELVAVTVETVPETV
jgi:hypothetical protein